MLDYLKVRRQGRSFIHRSTAITDELCGEVCECLEKIFNQQCALEFGALQKFLLVKYLPDEVACLSNVFTLDGIFLDIERIFLVINRKLFAELIDHDGW